MARRARMLCVSLLGFALLTPGCGRSASQTAEQRSAKSGAASNRDGQTYPSWAYDQPEYVKPAAELSPQAQARATDPLHYFSNQRQLMVRQPAGYKGEEVPRVALWWTGDNGFHWHKAGYFGRGQSYYPLDVKEDGDYGVSFIGPGQAAEDRAPAYPERVYHVDTASPEVELWVQPEKTWYGAGEAVTISWHAKDAHLVEFPVSIGMMMDFAAAENHTVELQRDLADEGSFVYSIGADAVDHEIWFRVQAKDRAENVGLAYSFALQVVEESLVKRASPKAPYLPDREGVVEHEIVVSSPKPGTATATVRVAAAEAIGPETPVDADCDEGVELARGGSESSDVTAAELEVMVAVAGDGLNGLFANIRGHIDDAVARGMVLKTLDDAMTRSEDGAAQSAASNPARAPEVEEPFVGNTQATAEPCDELTEEEIFFASMLDGDELLEEMFGAELGESKNSGEVASAKSVDMAPFDPTGGNGLLVPLPATAAVGDSLLAHDHPWRALGANRIAAMELGDVWTLPAGRDNVTWEVQFEGRFLADHPGLRNIAEPPGWTSSYAGNSRSQDGASVPR